jgi:drug/metabolite transporter (DMT)-like permease
MGKISSTLIGAIAVSLAAILWGLDGVVLTPRLNNPDTGAYLDVGYVVFILHLFPFIIMNFFLYREYNKLRSFSSGDLVILLLIALSGGVVGTYAIVKALFIVNFQHLTIVVLLQKLQPVFAILLAAVLLNEKIKRNFLFWAGLAIVASYFLTFGFALPNLKTGPQTFYAALYALLAAASFGAATVLGKKILMKYDFKTATFYRYGITVLIMLVFVLMTGRLDQIQQTTPTNWIIFFVIAFTTGSGAIFLYYYGLNKVKATVAAICELFFPLSVIVFDYLVNGNRLSLIQWISAAILIFAIINLNRSRATTLHE